MAEHPAVQLRLDSDKDRAVVTGLSTSQKYIVVTLDSGKIHVFDSQGTNQRVLASHSTAVWATDLWEDTLTSGDTQGNVQLWDLESGQPIHKFTGHAATVRSLKMPGPHVAISASRDTTLRIWDIQERKCSHVLEGHTSTVRGMDVSGDLIVSGSDDSTARIWSISQGRSLRVLHGHEGIIFAVAFDGKHIATGSFDESIRIWHPETGESLAVLKHHAAPVTRLLLHDDVLISGASNGTICASLIDGPESLGRLVYKIVGHENSVTILQVSGTKLLSGGSDGMVKVWAAHDGSAVGKIGPVAQAVWSIAASGDKLIVLACREQKTLFEIWNLPL